MDFLVEFTRTGFKFVVMAGVAFAGIILGMKLRIRKLNNTSPNDEKTS